MRVENVFSFYLENFDIDRLIIRDESGKNYFQTHLIDPLTLALLKAKELVFARRRFESWRNGGGDNPSSKSKIRGSSTMRIHELMVERMMVISPSDLSPLCP